MHLLSGVFINGGIHKQRPHKRRVPWQQGLNISLLEGGFKLMCKKVYRDSSTYLSVQEDILLRMPSTGDAPTKSFCSVCGVPLKEKR